jgi:hypothetical protein
MSEEEDNIKVWESFEKTDPTYAKKMTHGAKLTTINAYWQIKEATKKWGPYGGNWVLTIKKVELIEVIIPANFRYKTPAYNRSKYQLTGVFNCPEGHFDIITDWWADEDDALKKLETTTIAKALTRLGSGGDIYLKQYDDVAYVAERTAEALEDKNIEKAKASMMRNICNQWETSLKVALAKIQDPDKKEGPKKTLNTWYTEKFFNEKDFGEDKIEKSEGMLKSIQDIIDEEDRELEEILTEADVKAHKEYEQIQMDLKLKGKKK